MGGSIYRSARLVVGRSPREDEVEEVAAEEGWQRVERDSDGDVRRSLWAIAPGVSLTYTEDPVSHNSYVVISSEHRAGLDTALAAVGEELEPWNTRVLLMNLDSETYPRSRARAVIRAGLGAPYEFDEEFFTRIRDCMFDPERWVRQAAVWATAYSPWPEYKPFLERVARTDPEERLRTDATTVLAGFEHEHIAGPR